MLGLAALAVTAVLAYQTGIRNAEIKTTMICNLDDIAVLMAVKDSDPKALKKRLRDRYVWRYREIKKAYDQSLYRYPISLDKDIDLGFQLMEKQISKFDYN